MSNERKLRVEEISDIENIIGYTFKQKQLLQQAFIRSSYVNEHKEEISNEVLEFYGDRALDITVTKELSKRLGFVNQDGQYATQLLNGYENVNEGYLSMLRSELVCKGSLSTRINELLLDRYLITGKGDTTISESMKEDLFEAICGAMAIDSNWNFISLEAPILIMLNFEDRFYELTSEEPAIKFFLEWYRKHYKEEPHFFYGEAYTDNWDTASECILIITKTDEKRDVLDLMHEANYEYRYEGFGETDYEARRDAILNAVKDLFDNEKVYELFPDNDLDLFKKNWLNPSIDNSINIIQEMEQAKLIRDLDYKFEITSNDDNGNPIWSCEGSFTFNLYLKDGWTFKSKISSEDFKSKTDAKKHVALELIKHIFETYRISFPD